MRMPGTKNWEAESCPEKGNRDGERQKKKENRQKDRELEKCNDRNHDRRFILVVKKSMRGKVRT